MNELTEFYGRDEPSATYKWGVVVPLATQSRPAWVVAAWFKTRKRAEEYGTSRGDHAICRLGRLDGRLV